jgi:2-dehydropantoate 2-reductase
MNILIVGSGAIGGLIGARLSLAGHHPMFLDKPDVVEALRARGLTIVNRDGTSERLRNLTLLSAEDEIPGADLVVLAVKAHDIANVAPIVGRFTDRGVPLLTVQNGIPWWYFQRHGGELDGRHLRSLDPDGCIAQSIDPSHIIGGVAYPAAELVDVTTVRHVEGSGLPVGELDGGCSSRAEEVSGVLQSAGFKSRILTDIRSEIWLKAWGALTFNPISALTGATMQEICANPMTRGLVASMMQEAQKIAEQLGIRFRVTLERRIEGAERVGDHKTSMLQDREAGRKLEVEALLGAICEISQILKAHSPMIDSIYALTRLLDSCISSDLSGLQSYAER